MDFFAIGEKIKDLRKQLGLSQKDLANGICSQAQISKIEKGDVYPYAPTLYLISQRLGVDVNYFFDIGTSPRHDYIKVVARQLKQARRNQDYQTINEMITSEEKNPIFLGRKKDKQLIYWHKGICEYYINRDLNKALKILDEAIDLTHHKNWTEREIEILLSKGMILYEENLLKDAMNLYIRAKKYLHSLPYLLDDTIKSRLFFHIARTLTLFGQYLESIESCKQGIEWCTSRDNLYLLGELHYQTGYNYELLGDLSLAKHYMEKALTIFKLQNNEVKYIEYIEKRIGNW